MKYVACYEVEFKLCGLWAMAGAVWPKYEWKIVRPWYFLWLVKVPRLVDALSPADDALQTAINAATQFSRATVPNTPARIWEIKRRGTRYVSPHNLVWEIQ